jgi:CubicO group peptidase (beta-lactamase class C family)
MMRVVLFAAFSGTLMLTGFGCKSDPIKDRPISFSKWRADETIKYINNRYDREIDSLEMLPVMVVSHYTAMDSLEVSFKYMNNEEMESGRGLLKKAGGANIAVQFLVGKGGEIYRLMPENHIGRHVIGLNRHAIGIENVGKDEKALTKAQVDANAYIVRHLVKKFPIRYLIAHAEYRGYEKTPLWEEKDTKYRTEKIDPGESFMQPLRAQLADLNLKSVYDGGEIPTRLDYLLSAYHKKGEFSGNALVIRNGEVVFRKSFGDALKPDDALYLASAAKSLTAVAVAQLEAKRKISYTAPVARFFPELKHLLKGVQVRHLLAHTSGLEDYYKLVKAAPGFTNADALAAMATQLKPLSRPGTKFHYANSNYVLLSEIVARVSGQGFTAYVRENIFTPAGMTASLFAAETEPGNTIPALDAEGKKFQYAFKTSGAGGMYSTLDDIARFDQVLLGKKILSAAQFKGLIRPQTKVEAKETEYASGWYVYPKRDVIYHDGNFGGYHTMNWLQLKEKNAIILLGNKSTAKVKEITYEIDRILNGLTAQRLR